MLLLNIIFYLHFYSISGLALPLVEFRQISGAAKSPTCMVTPGAGGNAGAGVTAGADAGGSLGAGGSTSGGVDASGSNPSSQEASGSAPGGIEASSAPSSEQGSAGSGEASGGMDTGSSSPAGSGSGSSPKSEKQLPSGGSPPSSPDSSAPTPGEMDASGSNPSSAESTGSASGGTEASSAPSSETGASGGMDTGSTSPAGSGSGSSPKSEEQIPSGVSPPSSSDSSAPTPGEMGASGSNPSSAESTGSASGGTEASSAHSSEPGGAGSGSTSGGMDSGSSSPAGSGSGSSPKSEEQIPSGGSPPSSSDSSAPAPGEMGASGSNPSSAESTGSASGGTEASSAHSSEPGACGFADPVIVSSRNISSIGTFMIKCKTSCLVLDGNDKKVSTSNYRKGRKQQIWSAQCKGDICFLKTMLKGHVMDEKAGCRQSSNLITYKKHGGKNQQFIIKADGTIVTGCGPKFQVAVDTPKKKLQIVKISEAKKPNLCINFEFIPYSKMSEISGSASGGKEKSASAPSSEAGGATAGSTSGSSPTEVSEPIRGNGTEKAIGNLYWTDYSLSDRVPRDAILGGRDLDYVLIYVGRASYEGHILPSKLIPQNRKAYVSLNGTEYTVTRVQILRGKGAKWVQGNGKIPQRAVVGGISNGHNLYIGRYKYQSTITVGKIENGVCLIPFHSSEERSSKYEILIG